MFYVLNIGCGNSNCGMDIAKSYKNIVVDNMDICENVIEKMKLIDFNECQAGTTLNYSVMDVTKLEISYINLILEMRHIMLLLIKVQLIL